MSLQKEGELTSHQPVQPDNYTQGSVTPLLPLYFGSLLTIQKLDWTQFSGSPDPKMRWSAHVYWNIEYRIHRTGKRPHVTAQANLLTHKCWVRPERKCEHLLNHEQGHFLIANLCVLQFLRRVHSHGIVDPDHFDEFVQGVFVRTMKEYLEMERRYDDETEHRLNFKKQEEWDLLMKEKLQYYTKIFDKRKNKFGSLKKQKQ